MYVPQMFSTIKSRTKSNLEQYVKFDSKLAKKKQDRLM